MGMQMHWQHDHSCVVPPWARLRTQSSTWPSFAPMRDASLVCLTARARVDKAQATTVEAKLEFSGNNSRGACVGVQASS